jgi:hypothetical protein
MENSLELTLRYECVVLELANYSWIPHFRVLSMRRFLQEPDGGCWYNTYAGELTTSL